MDTVADMLTIIRNGLAADKKTVVIPFSKLKFEIAKLLKERDLIDNFSKTAKGGRRLLEISLKYEAGTPAITNLQRVSRPGQRVYQKSGKIKIVRQGFGFAIVSTSAGVMTDDEARKRHLGGEIICRIW